MAELKDTSTKQVQTTDGTESLTDVVLSFNSVSISKGTYAQIKYDIYKNETAESLNAMPIETKYYEVLPDKIIPAITDAMSLEHGFENIAILNENWHTQDDKGNVIDLELRKTRIFLKYSLLAELLTNGNENLVITVLNNSVPFVKNHIGVWCYFAFLGETPEEETANIALLESLGVKIQIKE